MFQTPLRLQAFVRDPSAGLRAAWKGREAGRCLPDGIGAQDRLGYHLSQCERSKANHLCRPNPHRAPCHGGHCQVCLPEKAVTGP